ncbi:MAG: hypothetical protein HY057_05410 [Rhodospirillales bacterium]|nr:hypothetical protein [Rhodospirillales bacterium]
MDWRKNRNPQVPAALRSDVSLHILGDEAVLFDGARQLLYAANTVAAFIWCRLEDRLSPADIAADVATTFSLPRPTADIYVADSLAAWRDLGLIDSAPPAPWRPPSPTAIQRRTVAVPPPYSVSSYRILDTTVALHFGDRELAGLIEPLLAHLAAPAATTPAAAFDLFRAGTRIVLAVDGSRIDDGPDIGHAAWMTMMHLADIALERDGAFCAFHAGAVVRHGRCLLLPGESGYGKSTLVAALIHSGFQLAGDDTIILAGDSLDVRPLPLPPCIKEGAWAALTPFVPGIGAATVHSRPDGRRLDYLPVPPMARLADPAAGVPVGWIVFPRYVAGAATQFAPLGKLAALQRLMPDFFPAALPLTRDQVERLARWIEGIECFDLRHSSLTEGVARLRALSP